MYEPTTMWKRIGPHSWRWEVRCNGEFVQGSVESTKQAAKSAANRVKNEIVCNLNPNNETGQGEPQIDIQILPPNVNAVISCGYMDFFEIINPFNDEIEHFTSDEISENSLAWLVGLCFYDSSETERVELLIAQLKVWGIYRGGENENEIKNIYHLEQSQIEIILAKSWHHISLRKIMEEDENGNIQEVLQWYFEV